MLPVCRFGIRSVGGGGDSGLFSDRSPEYARQQPEIACSAGGGCGLCGFQTCKAARGILAGKHQEMVRPLLSPKEQPRKYRVATFPAGEVYSLRQSSKRVRLRIRLMKTTVAAVRPADDSRVRPRGNRFLLRPPARTRICLPR